MDLQTTCPGCSTPLRVPAAAVGTAVGCPHCAARFQPTADGSAVPLPPDRRMPQRLALLAVGLLLLGAAGLAVNGDLALRTANDPAAALAVARTEVRQERLQETLTAPPTAATFPYPPAAAAAGVAAAHLTRDHLDEELAAARAAGVYRVNARFAAVSAVVVLGGVCVLFGRLYPLAVLGCVAAVVNVNHMCFVPGLLMGGWGVLTLARDDARPWFRRPTRWDRRPAGPADQTDGTPVPLG